MNIEDVAALRQAVDDCGDRGLLAASKWHVLLGLRWGIQSLLATSVGRLTYYNVFH